MKASHTVERLQLTVDRSIVPRDTGNIKRRFVSTRFLDIAGYCRTEENARPKPCGRLLRRGNKARKLHSDLRECPVLSMLETSSPCPGPSAVSIEARDPAVLRVSLIFRRIDRQPALAASTTLGSSRSSAVSRSLTPKPAGPWFSFTDNRIQMNIRSARVRSDDTGPTASIGMDTATLAVPIRFAVGVVAGIVATLAMDIVMARLPEGKTPMAIAAGVLTDRPPSEAPGRLATVVHYVAGLLTGPLFVWLLFASEGLLGTNSIVSTLAAAVVLFALMISFFAVIVLPRSRVADQRLGAIRRDWSVAAATYLAVLVPLVAVTSRLV